MSYESNLRLIDEHMEKVFRSAGARKDDRVSDSYVYWAVNARINLYGVFALAAIAAMVGSADLDKGNITKQEIAVTTPAVER